MNMEGAPFVNKDEPEDVIYNERVRELEQKRAKMIENLASMMHEKWRQGRYNPETKTYTPRLKSVKDQDWIAKHNGVAEVDIANTAFADLPADWREENFLSAKAAIEKIEGVLNLIHDDWLDRNDQSASPEQKAQYSRLPKAEKEKDIDVLEEALIIMRAAE